MWKTMNLPNEVTKLILEFFDYREWYKKEIAEDEIEDGLKRLAKRGNKQHAIKEWRVQVYV